MERNDVVETLKYVKNNSPQRNFRQRVDFMAVLKALNLKKPDQQVDFFMSLPHSPGKNVKVCGFVGPELYEQAKEVLDGVVQQEEFDTFAKDKRAMKKLARSYDFFISQANLMQKVAQYFGRTLGPLGKMPNPKAGCVVPPNANLGPVYEKLQYTLHVKVKNQMMYQASVGYEDSDEKAVVDNVMAVYEQLVHHLPLEKNNIKNLYMKLTMSPAVKIGDVSGSQEPVEEASTQKAEA